MKTITDKNIQGNAAEERRNSFEESNKLIAEADIDILITYQLFERIKPRLNSAHQTVFNSLYKMDQSTKNIAEYNITQSINLVVKAESKAREVIILTSNRDDYRSLEESKRVIAINPENFIKKINIARSLKRRGVVSSFDDALKVVFFLRYVPSE